MYVCKRIAKQIIYIQMITEGYVHDKQDTSSKLYGKETENLFEYTR